ncbi:MAG: amidohydrolase family protein [Candidatus Aminicenantaceae bacterium]
MPIVDVHNHFYPPEYLEAIQSGPSSIKVTFDAENNPLLHYPGDYNIVVPGHRDIEFRKQVLIDSGIDKQVLSMTTPGVHIETRERAIELAQMVNDSFARIAAEHGDHFAAFATLPLNDPEASVLELERAFTDLGFRGVTLHSNVSGKELSDPCFTPLFEKADELGAVIDIHPSFPVGVEAMTDYWLMPLVGFPFDTTLTAAKLVFSGIVEQFPRITWILGHLGGAIPYLAERLDRGFHAFKECRANITRPPSTYLKQFYYDTVNFDAGPLKLALEFAGPDHLVAGSDYPHQIGSLDQMVTSIEALELPETDKDKIRGATAARLLGL